MKLQQWFDNYLIESAYSNNRQCHHAITVFCEMAGIEDASILDRVPPKKFAFVPVRAWLFQAYPQFMEAVLSCDKKGKPLTNIRLDLLIFRPPGKVECNSQAGREGYRHSQKRMQANGLQYEMIGQAHKNGYTSTRIAMKGAKRAR